MKIINRVNLEDELYIFQREDVSNAKRWYVAFKLNGYKRRFLSLGVTSQKEAEKKARQQLLEAEKQILEGREAAYLGKNRINDAYDWFIDHGRQFVESEGRYRIINAHWKNHLKDFFGGKSLIDKQLQDRMSTYVEYRRRVINKRTNERLHSTVGTIKLEIVSAKQLLKLAREHAGIGSDTGNLTLKLKKSKLQHRKTKSTTFEDAEIEKIKSFFDADEELVRSQIGKHTTAKLRLFYLARLRMFVALAFATGARVEEMRQVRIGDFGDDFKTVKIRKSKTVKGSGRIAFIDNEIWDIHDEWKRYSNFLANSNNKNVELFVDKRGSRISRMSGAGISFTNFLKRHKMLYEKKHGKRKRDFYATRHYWITRQVDAGMQAFDVAQSAGTSVKHIEATYYEQDASQLVKSFEERSKKSAQIGHLKVVK